ncbi:unnamed protein product [Microthlaspi erraticum]|uniref:Uncharacterized protein n=1 Tax=Microthlaspi erraticum TaxID=1685480 RepID=A0A6D2IEG5_9BRAS|nr:unnamed protein product [Microthlaspi erraticum]
MAIASAMIGEKTYFSAELSLSISVTVLSKKIHPDPAIVEFACQAPSVKQITLLVLGCCVVHGFVVGVDLVFNCACCHSGLPQLLSGLSLPVGRSGFRTRGGFMLSRLSSRSTGKEDRLQFRSVGDISSVLMKTNPF